MKKDWDLIVREFLNTTYVKAVFIETSHHFDFDQPYFYNPTLMATFMGYLAAQEKLEGCVVVPVRSDKEIIDQTIELTDLLATSTNRFQRDPNCLFPFESNNPRVKEWWYVACQIQELLTQTDPNNCDLDEYKADVEAARGGK